VSLWVTISSSQKASFHWYADLPFHILLWAFMSPAMTILGAAVMVLQSAFWASFSGVVDIHDPDRPLASSTPETASTWTKSAAPPVIQDVTCFLLVTALAVHTLDVSSPFIKP